MTATPLTSAHVQQLLHIVITDPSRAADLDKVVVDSFHHANESAVVAAELAWRDLIDEILVYLTEAEERHFLKDLLQHIDGAAH